MCNPAWGRALTQAQRLKDFARLRRVRDRIDRECAQPLDIEALAREAGMAAEDLSRGFRLAYGKSPDAYLVARRGFAGPVRLPVPVPVPARQADRLG